MPRHHRALRRDTAGPARPSAGRTEDVDGEPYEVRTVAGEPGRPYRCPGCDQLIAPATLHVVAWAAAGEGDDRRHWHTACWRARHRRGVTRRWR